VNVQRVIHKPTPLDASDPFTGFGEDGNGFEILNWVNSNGGTAHGAPDGKLYIKRPDGDERDGETWIVLNDRVGRRIRPDGTPTNDFYRVEPEVWRDNYGGQP
jgi:hypothetical protein